ncbi:phosphoglycerate kinase domain protein, partial [Streptococcus pneumoniae 3063-00]
MSFKLSIGKVAILDIPATHNEAIISIFPYANKENIIRDYLMI